MNIQILQTVSEIFQSQFGEKPPVPEWTTASIALSSKGVLLLFILAVTSLSLVGFLKIWSFPLIIASLIIGSLAMIQRQIAYFDENKIVIAQTTDLLKRKYIRMEIPFSKVIDTKLQCGGRVAIFTLNLKTGKKIKMEIQTQLNTHNTLFVQCFKDILERNNVRILE